jgi:hypothetical protein
MKLLSSRSLGARSRLSYTNGHAWIARTPLILILKVSRRRATQSSLGGTSGPTRKQITVVSDDGRVKWGQLNAREKVARTTQKSFHLGIILTGVVMTVGFDCRALKRLC